MKFFIFLCCIAYLLLEISAKIWRTTPMTSVNQKRLSADEATQVSKFAAMIDFVNNVHTENDDDQSFFGRYDSSKRQIFQRFDEPMSAMYRLENAKDVSDEDSKVKFDKMADTVRYHIIENPEVLLKYKNKQKKKFRRKLDPVNVFLEAKSFSTAENKLNDFPTQIESAAVLHDNGATTAYPEAISRKEPAVLIRAHHDYEYRNTDKVPYTPSFPDEDDDDKPSTEAIHLKKHKKENIKSKTHKKEHKVPLEVIKSDEVDKKTQNSKASGKKVKKHANTNISNKTGSIKNKHSVPQPNESHEKQSDKDSVRPKDKHHDKKNKKDGITNKNSEKDKNKHESYLTPVERLISNIDNDINNDRIDHHFIYEHEVGTENSNKHHNNNHEHIDKYDTKKNDKHHNKKDEKHSLWIKVNNEKEEKWDKNHREWSEKERELDNNFDKWIKNDKDKANNEGSKSKKEKTGDKTNNKYSKTERLSKRDKELDKSYDKWSEKDKDKVNKDDTWSKIEKNQDKNIDQYSNKETNWDKNDDTPKTEKDQNKMDKQRDLQDKTFDKMEYEWNKRHQDYEKDANDAQWVNIGNQDDKDFNERDDEFKNRDNEWIKRDDDLNKKHGESNIFDRNGSPKQYSDEHMEEETNVRPDRYKIVDRNSRESSRDDHNLP